MLANKPINEQTETRVVEVETLNNLSLFTNKEVFSVFCICNYKIKQLINATLITLQWISLFESLFCFYNMTVTTVRGFSNRRVAVRPEETLQQSFTESLRQTLVQLSPQGNR